MSSARTIRIAAVTAGLVGGALVPAASAATLHVAPHRLLKLTTVLPCTADRPCNLGFALSSAGPGDDVAMAPGDYRPPTLTRFEPQGPYAQSLVVGAGVVLHGEPGAPLPVIHSSVPVIAPAVDVRSGGVLRDVAIEATAPAATPPNYGYGVVVAANALVDRSRIRWTGVSGTVGTACAMVGGTVRNSECLGTGTGGYAHALTGTGSGVASYRVTNVTAITTSPFSDGVRVGTANAVATMIATNVIARGPAGDMSARVGLSGGAATLVADHSNWRTESVTAAAGGTAQLIRGTGDQTGPPAAEPLFVDAAAGDYRTAPGSPTIDAGSSDPATGALALRGAARIVGGATDIGADEFTPPPPTPPPATTPTPPVPPTAPTATGTGANARPVLTGLTIARTWSRKVGTTIRFTLSEPATVTLTFAPQTTGRRTGRACRATTKANHARPHCTLSQKTGTRTVTATTGTNTLTFTGRLSGGRRLATGAHRVTATARDASGAGSTPRTARFVITR